MFAQHPRFGDGAVFARFAADAGYDAMKISHSTPTEKVRAIIDAGVLPIASVHQPAPWQLVRPSVANSDLNLAAIDESERAEAITQATRSIDLAAEVGARAVVLHLGHIGSVAGLPDDARLRTAFDSGVDATVRAELLRARSASVEPHLASARRSLVELLGLAAPRRIVLGVESRLNLHEIPLPSELPFLLDGLDPAQTGYWHDVGHVEVLHRLGYVGRDAWFNQPGVSVVGAHVHDTIGILDHRAPGRGDVDLAWHLSKVAHIEMLTLEINQFEPDETVRATPSLLRERLSARS